MNEVPGRLRIAFIGFGEVGRRFADDLHGQPGLCLSTYDILEKDPAGRAAYEDAAAKRDVLTAPSPAAAAKGADIVISAVTAAAVEEVAKHAANYLTPGQIFFDINSAAPSTKQRASAHFVKAGDYVEGAVMAPVKQPGIGVSILSGGRRAEEVSARLNAIGFNIRPVSTKIGRASATKLCRSIMIKGLEALLVDCTKASEHAGVKEPVFASLRETFPSIDWHALADDMKERVSTHGIRRAEEMREAAHMLADFGLDPELAKAVAAAQARGAKVRG